MWATWACAVKLIFNSHLLWKFPNEEAVTGHLLNQLGGMQTSNKLLNHGTLSSKSNADIYLISSEHLFAEAVTPFVSRCGQGSMMDADSHVVLSQAEFEQRLHSSFLLFPGWLLTLCLYLINDTTPPVVVVIKSNEVPNGWGFVESAVGNWGGGCLRWLCVLIAIK